MKNELAKVDPGSPAGLMMQLMSGEGALDVDAFGKMLEFQREHDKDQARKAYHAAMADFQAEAPKIIKTQDGHNCRYAALSDIVAVIAPKLSEHGLSHSWVTSTDDKVISVTCKITHALGHSEETALSAGPDGSGSKNAIQAIGSTITYLQRYTLKAALGIAEGGQDDDGAGAEDKKPKILEPNAAEQKFIDAVCEKLPQEDGKIVNKKKVGLCLYSKACQYPKDLQHVTVAAEWIMNKLDTPELYMEATGENFAENYNIDPEDPPMVDENGNPT